MVKVGVLALQGAFAKHKEALEKLGAETALVKKKEDLEGLSGLILPGGESTAMLRLLNFLNMDEALLQFAASKPIFGTCAGLILMAKEALADPMRLFGLLDITVERNAYGPQVESFFTELDMSLEKKTKEPAFFIRAPRIVRVGKEVEVLALKDGEPVLVKSGRFLGSTFHPELTESTLVHHYFLKMIRQQS